MVGTMRLSDARALIVAEILRARLITCISFSMIMYETSVTKISV
jgi:hypothetical protein